MEFKYLADRREAIPAIAEWYYNEWGYRDDANSIEKTRKELQMYMNRDKIPLLLMAVDGAEILGVAQLKYHEMHIYPGKVHWLGGVFVPKNHRGRSIASSLIKKLITIAHSLGVDTLHLQTEWQDGGLYSKLGWRAVEKVRYNGKEVLVMERSLND